MDIWSALRPSAQEIRLLSLEPSNDQAARLVCKLQTVSLQDNPEYEALSYVWGKASDREVIMLNGQEHSITINLFDALTHLRYQDRSRSLWVDAICINQTDIDERQAQVAIMGTLYSKAMRTVVWLGSHAKFLDEVSAIANGQLTHFEKFPMHLFALTAQEVWWARAWTLQEAVLGRDLVFYAKSTNSSASIHDLEVYAEALYEHLLAPRGCCKKVMDDGPVAGLVARAFRIIEDLLQRRRNTIEGREFDLLDLVFTYNSRSATNMRDRVFAYAGLASSVPTELINYKMSLVDCFIQCAKAFIEGSHGAEVFSYVVYPAPRDLGKIPTNDTERGMTGPRERLKGLPSWCPDWSQLIWTSHLDQLRIRHATHENFSAGLSDKKPESQIRMLSDRRLHTLGTICDVVEAIGPYEEVSIRMAADVWSQWCTLVRESPCYWSSVSCDECNTLIWGRRYKCATCDNFDLCGICVNNQKECHPGHKFEVMMPEHHKANRDLSKGDSPRPESKTHRAIIEKLSDGRYSITNAKWDELSNARYPFTVGETVQDAFRKTLMMDQTAFPQPESEDFSAETISLFDAVAFTEFWSREVEERPLVLVPPRVGHTMEEVENMLGQVGPDHVSYISKMVMIMTDRRRLLVTRKGYIGLGPAGTKPGDIICVLSGARVPHIVHELPPDSAKTDCEGIDCTLVGDAYIHGLMTGRAIELAKEGVFERRNIIMH